MNLSVINIMSINLLFPCGLQQKHLLISDGHLYTYGVHCYLSGFEVYIALF
jgi:hypothetical protein